MFSRLEENRVKLEQQLGCDTFLKAYKTVQVSYILTCRLASLASSCY